MDKLGFRWDEVHELAEELEHIPGEALIERLDAFLDHPKFDPHGDPIPDREGRWQPAPQSRLAEMQPGQRGLVSGVDDHSTAFLQYLQQLNLMLGTEVELLERFDYDQSVRVRIGATQELILSEKVALNLFLKI